MAPARLPIDQPVCVGYGLQAFDPPIQRICLHLRKRRRGSNHPVMILPVTLQHKQQGRGLQISQGALTEGQCAVCGASRKTCGAMRFAY